MLGTTLLIFAASIIIGVLVYLGVTLVLERATMLRAWGNLTEVLRDLSK